MFPYKDMWKFMEEHAAEVFVDKTSDGVKMVRDKKGKYAFLLESSMNEYYNQRKPCNTMKVGPNLDSKGYGVATPIGHDLKDEVNHAILELKEKGELAALEKIWWYEKGECGRSGGQQDSKQSSLTLSNVAGIFYILIGGLGLAMVTSLVEFLIKYRMEASEMRRIQLYWELEKRNACPFIDEEMPEWPENCRWAAMQISSET